MAKPDQSHPANVDGPWFVDTRCIACDVARHWAPGLIRPDERAHSFLARQSTDSAEESALWRAAHACPTQSISNRAARQPPAPPFPYEMTDGVWALGHNARETFGAHAWLVQRPEGNLLIDVPRFSGSLAAAVEELGGVARLLLTHQDHVAGGDAWVERFGAEAWIHESEASAAAYATNHFGDTREQLWPGVTVMHIPGHTRGSMAFHIDERVLFTGDSLRWNVRRATLDVFPRQTWQSWSLLADSMDALAQLRVEWVLPGHGMWARVGFEEYARQMASLGADMRRIGQGAWSRRPAH